VSPESTACHESIHLRQRPVAVNGVRPSEEVGTDPHTASCRVTRCSGILKDRKRSEAAEATAADDEARRTREQRLR